MTSYDEGYYKASVVEQAWQRASTGNRMLVFVVRPTARVVERLDGKGAVVREDVPVDGTNRTVRLVITQKTASIVGKKLRASGFTGTKWSEVAMLGNEVKCTCSYEFYDGKEVERWDLAFPETRLEQDETVVSELDAEIPFTAGAGAESAPATAPAEDDIDF